MGVHAPAQCEPSAWIVHIPFIFWLIDAAQPGVFVHVGRTAGDSYFTFCVAVQRSALKTRCFAVESDERLDADDPASDEDESSFDIFNSPFHQFSTRLVTPVDDDASAFPDRSIDLLHIHGRRRRDSLTRVFQGWAPKLSDRGLVLLHHTCDPERDDAGQFIRTLEGQYAALLFTHRTRVGARRNGATAPAKLERFMTSVKSHPSRERARRFYARIGQDLLGKLHAHAAETPGTTAGHDKDERTTDRLGATERQDESNMGPAKFHAMSAYDQEWPRAEPHDNRHTSL